MHVIGLSWKFKLKRDKTGFVIKFKARLVPRGDMQAMDWNSVFAPTVKYTTLRAILALAAHHDYEIKQMDVVTTFLNADVVSEVYMEQLVGFTTVSPDATPLCANLKKLSMASARLLGHGTLS
jgi:hypothetical protein